MSRKKLMMSFGIFSKFKKFKLIRDLFRSFSRKSNDGFSIEEIKKYLPKYLSEESYDELLKELDKFPDNSDESYYTLYLNNHTTLYQGDGLDEMPFSLLPKNEVNNVPVIILSNSCDMDQGNENPYNETLVYAPIIPLSNYLSLLENLDYREDQIQSYESEIKRQKISSIFFLPGYGDLDDSIVKLNYISSCNIGHINPNDVPGRRLFSLSNVGFYLFLFKISVHFTRVREGVDRNNS